MFQSIDYDNFPFIISSGKDFNYEIESIKREILPKVKSLHHNKLFSMNTFDLIYQNCKPIDSCELNDFVLLNLDSIHRNGSICICLLGEQFEQEPSCSRNASMASYAEQLNESTKHASESGYPWIEHIHQESDHSLVEILSLHAGLTSHVKFPLFYFRVSGGPISEEEQQCSGHINDLVNEQMDRLKHKLIRNGVPVKFYGSTSEFKDVVEADLNNIFSYFPDKTIDQDEFHVDQQCYENDHMKSFIPNDNIQRIFHNLDDIYSSLTDWNHTDKNAPPTKRIEELISDFYRKEFSDRLTSTYKKLSGRASQPSSACHSSQIAILTGPRGSGKSTILINWLKSKKENTRIIHAPLYCEASFASSDLRMALRKMVQQIRSSCGFSLELDNLQINSLDAELMSLSQELLGAMLLARQHGFQLLIVIDGLDHLGDRCVSCPKQIKFIDWIPESIPDNVRIIISCTHSDLSLIELKVKRTDLTIIETLPDCGDLQQLLIESGLSGLQNMVAGFNQSFSSDLLQCIDNWPLIRIPLVQKILAQLNHTTGTTSHWNHFVEKVSECQTLVELIKRVLKLVIHFLNWELVISADKTVKKKYIPKKDEDLEESSIQGWVPDFLSLVALSRCGLHIDVIVDSLELLGYTKDFRVLESDLWRMFHFTRDFLLRFHNDKFMFAHSICLEIVEHAFLAIASCSSVEARSQECQDSIFLDKRCKMHILLAYSLWNRRSTSDNHLSECLYHLDRASNHQSLERIIFNPRVLLSLFDLDIEHMSNWYGCLGNTHEFQHYWNSLSREGLDFVSNIKKLLSHYYNLEVDGDKKPVANTAVDAPVPPKQLMHQKSHFQSEFAKRLIIKTKREEDKVWWSRLNVHQKYRFLLLVAQVCAIMDHKSLVRQIYSHIEQTYPDSTLTCHVLWFDMCLDGSLHSLIGNNDGYVESVASRLQELTGSILEENFNNPVDDLDRIKYLRCLSLVFKISVGVEPSQRYSFHDEYHELIPFSRDLKSVVIRGLVKELEYNSMEISEDLQVVQEKLTLLSNLIVKLETWTGPVHQNMARLFVKLAHLFKRGNSQSRFKAEACCRRALWIWKKLLRVNENQYNNGENECIEILYKLLLQDPSHSSLSEAKNQIYTSFDNRMKFLGCYHPLTTQLVPVIKLVNSLDARFSYQHNSANINEASGESPSSTKNQSNCKIIKSIMDPSRGIRSGNSRLSGRPKQSPSSSLQFINRYSSSSDCFSEDIDWNDIANGRPASKSSRASGSRLNSAFSKRNSAISFHSNYSPRRCQSTSLYDGQLTYTLLGHNSSLSSLISPTSSGAKYYMSRAIKQVRFNNMNMPIKAEARSAEMARIIQKKLLNINSLNCEPVSTEKESVSVNFSRPYPTIDPVV